MDRTSITQAVILAAGNGSRLAAQSAFPKPLITIGERAVLDHILGRLAEQRIDEVIVVIGYRGDEIRSYPYSINGDLQVRWVSNDRYDLPNGISLLAAEKQVETTFLLLMADHMFQRSTLDAFLKHSLNGEGGVLATDAKTDEVFDLQDATKVQSRGDRVEKMGKHLSSFNSIDTGMFLLNPSVFAAMRQSVEEGDASLTGGISKLAGSEGVRTWNIGLNRWIDIDTAGAHREAERLYRSGHLS